MGLLNKLMSIFTKQTSSQTSKKCVSDRSSQTSKKAESDRFLQELAQKSPRSKCGVCGKDVRGPSGGLVIMQNVNFSDYLNQQRLVCPSCGFIGCFNCCANMELKKSICPQCGDKMEFS